MATAARTLSHMSETRPPRVPPSLDLAAAISWRLLLIAAALVVSAIVIIELRLVLLPVIFALFASAVLTHPARWLHRRGVPRAAAAALAEVGAVGVIAALIVVLAPFVGRQFADVGPVMRAGVEEIGRAHV